MVDWVKQYNIDFSKFLKKVSKEDFNNEITFNILQFGNLVPETDVNWKEKVEEMAINAAICKFNNGN